MSEIDPRADLSGQLLHAHDFLVGTAIAPSNSLNSPDWHQAVASARAAVLQAIDALSIQPAMLKAGERDQRNGLKLLVSQMRVCADVARPSPDDFTYLNAPAREMLHDAVKFLTYSTAPIPEQAGVGVKGLAISKKEVVQNVAIYTIEDGEHVYLTAFGSRLGQWQLDTPEALSVLKLCTLLCLDDGEFAEQRIRSAPIPASPTEPVEGDVAYLMSVIDAAIEDGFDPDEDGLLLDEIRASIVPSSPPASGEQLPNSVDPAGVLSEDGT